MVHVKRSGTAERGFGRVPGRVGRIEAGALREGLGERHLAVGNGSHGVEKMISHGKDQMIAWPERWIPKATALALKYVADR